ncbi:hypothetical protein ABTM04_20660, partial [Acinetobacter baumannii]
MLAVAAPPAREQNLLPDCPEPALATGARPWRQGQCHSPGPLPPGPPASPRWPGPIPCHRWTPP